MKAKEPTPGRRERKLVQLGAGLLLLVLVIAAGWYLTSPHFENWMRLKVIAELQAVTGGRVEIGSLRWSFSRLEVDIHDLTVHGLEPPGEAPYAHVDHLVLRLKVLSLFSGQFGLRTLIAERPVIHITVGPHGASNQPVPLVAQQRQPISAQQLFDLGIERAEISGGELIWNDRHMPLNLRADDVAARLVYVPAAAQSAGSRFDGAVKIGKLDSVIKDLRPFSSMLEADFSLLPTAVDLRSLRWQSGDSALSLKGRIADLSALKLEGDYDLVLDLRQVGGIVRAPQLRAGVLQLIGQETLSSHGFSSQGKMHLRKAEWSDSALRAPGLNVSADFSANQTELALFHILGNGFGGRLSGEAQWHDWMASFAAIANTKAPVQAGAAHFHLQAMKASALAKAFSSRTLPLDRLPFAGDISGDVDLGWKGSFQALQTAMALAVVPPAQTAGDAIPLRGEFRGKYQRAGNRLEIADAHLATRFTTALASGSLGAERSMLNLNLKSTDASELQSLFSAFNISGIPLELHGTASFLGVITGRLNAAAINGHVDLTDFYSLFPSAPESNGPARLLTVTGSQPQSSQRMHWDGLSADIHLDPGNVAVRQGALQRGKTQLDVRFSAALHRYKLASNDQFSAGVVAHDASVEDLQSLAGVRYPVTGTANLTLQLSGTRLDPRGEGSFDVVNGSLWGTPFKSLRSRMSLLQQEVQFKDFVLALNGARVTGTANYNLANQGVRFQVAGENFNLAHITRLSSKRFSVEGEGAFQASGSWTLNAPSQNAPVLNMKATLRNLVLNGERQGDLSLEASTQGDELRLKAYSQLQAATLQLDGTVQLRGSWPADVTLNLRRLDFDPLLYAYLKGHITGHSSAEGSLHLQGPLRNLKEINLTGEFPQLSAEIANVKLSNQGPIRFSAAQGVLQLEQMHIVGEGTDFSAQGPVPLFRQAPVNLSANGELNLRVLRGYYPGLQSSGSVSIAMKIAGTWDQPTVGGQVQISNAGFSLIDLPNGLSEMNGTLVFNQNRLNIQSLTARTGGGELKLSGFMAYSQGIYFDVAATGSDVRVRYPPGVSAEVGANLRFVGSSRSSTLSGEITVNKFSLTPSFDFGSYLVGSKQTMIASSADSSLNNIHFAVHIVSRPELQVQSSLARASGDADLNLRGTMARPALLGRINISSGDFSFNGAKYHLERGDILFVNPLGVDPVLDLSVTTRVRDYDVTLGLHGPANHLTATYRSDPPLPTADVIALLALGRTRQEPVPSNTQSSSTITDAAANAILGQALNYALSSRVQRLFGASRIKIDPGVGEPGAPNARLTVEQAVSGNVIVTYITNLSTSAQQVIQVEIQLNQNLSLVGLRDQYGVVGFDFRIRQRKR